MTHDSTTKPVDAERFDHVAMYVIYDHPHDSPAGYLIREWVVRRAIVAPGKVIARDLVSLDDARARIPAGCVNIGRSHADDAKIVEVWL